MSESEVHKLAKSMMLRDLRGHLTDWEEGKFTWLDINTVSHLLENILSNWKHYEEAAKSDLEPKQLPLPEIPGHIPDGFEGDLDQWIGEDIEDEIRRQG